MGCALHVELEDGAVAGVSGNTCKRGLAYAQAEATHPTRMLTTTLRVQGGRQPLVPVRTCQPVPKEHLLDYMSYLNGLRVKAPVAPGTKLCSLPGCGIDVMATAGVEAAAQ